MMGERENFGSQTQYGSLFMRAYDIDGNKIDAFYDSADDLIFVLDNTINPRKPNILLVINPESDKKWDEILSADYGVDLETIRPKQDNKYQKFDIEYSGLAVYDALIKAYNAGDSLEESLKQLMVLRDSAARHSAMMRLNIANEIIAKTNATIIKTKESVVRLHARLKTLRAKLAETKKSIGREPTKQSASKILKLESQIEATNEKLKRANERLKSAQQRLETATVDAELASQLLSQPLNEVKQVSKKNTSIVVPVKRKSSVKIKTPELEYDEYEESDEDFFDDTDGVKEETTMRERIDRVEETEKDYEEEEKSEKIKPLFNEDPQILDDNIAFKPINFDAPAVLDITKSDDGILKQSQDMVVTEEIEKTDEVEPENKQKEHLSVLESIKPVPENDDFSMPVFEPETTEQSNIVEEDLIEEHPDKTDSENGLKQKRIDDSAWQYAPEVAEESNAVTEEKTSNEYVVVSPAVPVAPVIPQSVSNTTFVDNVEPKKSKLFYYLLLILLIVLAVFTLWLYQKNIKPSVPVLAASVEKTELPKEQSSVFKKTGNSSKTSKNIKAPVVKEVKLDDVDSASVFLDEEPVVAPMPEPAVEDIPVVSETVEENVVEPVKTAPEIIDAVPARVTTSGQNQEPKGSVVSEEDVLANKPSYQPGSKYDEMFVPDEGGEVINSIGMEYVEDVMVGNDVVYTPGMENTTEYVNEEDVTVPDDVYFDEEEAAYQAEQENLYYEE